MEGLHRVPGEIFCDNWGYGGVHSHNSCPKPRICKGCGSTSYFHTRKEFWYDSTGTIRGTKFHKRKHTLCVTGWLQAPAVPPRSKTQPCNDTVLVKTCPCLGFTRIVTYYSGNPVNHTGNMRRSCRTIVRFQNGKRWIPLLKLWSDPLLRYPHKVSRFVCIFDQIAYANVAGALIAPRASIYILPSSLTKTFK